MKYRFRDQYDYFGCAADYWLDMMDNLNLLIEQFDNAHEFFLNFFLDDKIRHKLNLCYCFGESNYIQFIDFDSNLKKRNFPKKNKYWDVLIFDKQEFR